jgi:hypothetical protein
VVAAIVQNALTGFGEDSLVYKDEIGQVGLAVVLVLVGVPMAAMVFDVLATRPSDEPAPRPPTELS